MDPTSRPSQKFLHKFTPFKRKELRHAHSAEAIRDPVSGVEGASDPAQRSEGHQSNLSDTSIMPMPTRDRFKKQWSVWPSAGSDMSMSHSALPVPRDLPSYTPIPLPQRISSANREATVYEQHKQKQALSEIHQAKAPSADADQDDISLRLGSAFDDDLLRPPRTPISPLVPPKSMATAQTVGDSPVLGHLSTGSHQPQKQLTERPRGRSRPPTPADSAAKESVSDSRSRAGPGHEVQSPPASILSYNSYNFLVPPKLGPEALASLQTPSPDKSDVLDTELIVADDPDSWDLVNPNTKSAEEWDRQLYSLEKRAEQLYSAEHLHIILEDKQFHFKFSTFLRKYRPWRLPILEYYWDALKAIRAWDYANSLTQLLAKKPLGDTQPPGLATNSELRDSAQEALKELLGDDLHWYIAHTYIGIVRTVLQSRITGTLPAPLREASTGLAEVFCITDPTRRDNPIILASQAFTRHSGCNMDYILGRNCRFMQGPGTTVDSCRRFAISIEERRDHSEIFVNYRRDGSPFLSLVMNAALLDSRGDIRYYLGAQVDVSGLLKSCSGLESLPRLIEKQSRSAQREHDEPIKPLSEMFTDHELDIIGKNGGVLKKPFHHELQNTTSPKLPAGPTRVLLADGSDDSDQGGPEPEPRPPASERNVPKEDPLSELNLRGVYKNYLLIRPVPSLRILFASPTLRVPGVLQSQFLDRIGSARMRHDLENAFQEPKVVTARVRWLKNVSADGEGDGYTRWIHCTPLMHHTGRVGLWMVVIVKPSDDDTSSSSKSIRGGGSRLGHRSTSDMDMRKQDRSKNRYAHR